MAVKVCLDGVAFEHDGNLGIWRIYHEVLRRVADRAEFTLWLRSPPTRPVPPGVAVAADSGRLYFPRYQILSRIRRTVSRARVPRACKRADVFQTTFLSANPCPHVPEVFTVCDMIQERCYSVSGPWAEDMVRSKRERIRSASLLVCISEATAAELRLFYPETAGRIRVVPLGSEHLAPPLGRRRQRRTPPEDRFVLFVGQRLHHKNFVCLLEALNTSCWPAGLGVRVVGPAFSFAEELLIRALRLGDRVRHLGRLSDEELRQQYQNAFAFVYPSLHEGFGLPVLEAQANGAPAVLSDIPVFREIAGGDGAVFFDPRLPDRLAEAVAATGGPVVRKRLTEAGRANVRRFSWDRCAEQTLDVYEEAAKLRGR